jgi:hypothetical protein
MRKISYDGYRFPLEIIQQAIWLYLRVTLSFRDVEDLLAERGVVVSYESVRRWVNHFGPTIAADLRRRRAKPCRTWHLDEVYLKIAGRMVYPNTHIAAISATNPNRRTSRPVAIAARSLGRRRLSGPNAIVYEIPPCATEIANMIPTTKASQRPRSRKKPVKFGSRARPPAPPKGYAPSTRSG